MPLLRGIFRCAFSQRSACSLHSFMRTRFAPSPTGWLHVGGLRTALMSYIVAKQTGGEFLLRIEDTDRKREIAGAVENILSALCWAGIAPDEGVVMENGIVTERGGKGPYKQSKRLPLYKNAAETLLSSGHAYRCFCTSERLEQMRLHQQERHQAPKYDGRCRSLEPGEAARRAANGELHVLRLAVPQNGTIAFTDDIRGEVEFGWSTVDDQVLLKSDGGPTYHLAHVIDDHHMDIDLVIRGEEWLSSLPKHLLLFQALGWKPPRFAHVPLLLNADKSKLSKRQGDVAVEEYIAKGYLPEAMVNFLALLGWNPGTTQELFSLQELMESFSLERVQKAGAIFDLQKLAWLQGQWMRRISLPEFAKRVQVETLAKLPEASQDMRFAEKAALIQERITFFHEASDMLRYFYRVPAVPHALLINPKQNVSAEELPRFLNIIKRTLTEIAEWKAEAILGACKVVATKEGVKLGQLLWPLRVVLTGREYSPGAVEVAEVLGKEETLRRLSAIARHS